MATATTSFTPPAQTNDAAVLNTMTASGGSPLSPSTPLSPSATSYASMMMPSIYHMELYDNSDNTHNSNIISPIDQPDSDIGGISQPLIPCPICSRTFNPITLDKHVGICEKMATKKRNVFDSSRQRREGTELAAYPLPKNYGLPPVANKHEQRGQSPKPQQHIAASPILTRKRSTDDFVRSTARTSMRKLSTSSSISNTTIATNASAPPATINAGGGHFQRDHRMRSSERSLTKRSIQPPPAEQCPHCERCFGIKAYDRHVEWCKEKALQASIKQTSKTEQNIAKERLEARTKYRAPCLKTKRSLNRDKYSGFTGAGDENESIDSPKSFNHSSNSSNTSTNIVNNNSNNIMSLSMTSSITSERNPKKAGNVNQSLLSQHDNQRSYNLNDDNTVEQHEQKQKFHQKSKAHDDENNTMEKDVFDFRITGEKLETYNTKKQAPQQRDRKKTGKQATKSQNSLPTETKDEIEFKELKELNDKLKADRLLRKYIDDNNIISMRQTDPKKEDCPNAGVVDNNELSNNARTTKSSKNIHSFTSLSNTAIAAYQRDDETMTIDDDELCYSATLNKSSSSTTVLLAKRKLKTTKQNSNINLRTANVELASNKKSAMADLTSAVAAATAAAAKTKLKASHSVDALKTLMRSNSNKSLNSSNCMALPQIQQQQQLLQQRRRTIFEMPHTSAANMTPTTTPAVLLHTKLEANPINALPLCRLKRQRKKLRTQQQQQTEQPQSTHATDATFTFTTAANTPLKAMRSATSFLSIDGGDMTENHLWLPSSSLTDVTNKSDSADHTVSQNVVEKYNNDQNDAADDDDSNEKKEIKIIKAPPAHLESSKLTLALEPPKITRNKSFILSGLPDKYDPFLSAKRQLEDLCSSTTASPTPADTSKHTTPSAKMSTSLILGSSPQTPNPRMTASVIHTNTHQNTNNNNNNNNNNTNSTTNRTATNNFRRTSSLRGPRRSPLLPSRPLFAKNHRPTIQRGLSDEGPISTNFLKPEEYDEMPVRSICVNDYAATKSPRVIRRDTSNSNRKHNLKLNVVNTTASHGTTRSPQLTPGISVVDGAATKANVNSSSNGGGDGGIANASNNSDAAKYLSKTDSLAVFLKYETELEKLTNNMPTVENNDNTVLKPAPKESNISSVPTVTNNLSEPEPAPLNTNLPSPIITKEFKDKSNALSKQNSAKSIQSDASDSGESTKRIDAKGICTKSPSTPQATKPAAVATQMKLPTPGDSKQNAINCNNIENNSNYSNNNNGGKHNQPLRLEPIAKIPMTPPPWLSTYGSVISKPTTPKSIMLPAVGIVGNHDNQLPINLNAIFGAELQKSQKAADLYNNNNNNSRGHQQQHQPQQKSNNIAASTIGSTPDDYIDPKLINQCDNLPVQRTNTAGSAGGARVRALDNDSEDSSIAEMVHSSSASTSSSSASERNASHLPKATPLAPLQSTTHNITNITPLQQQQQPRNSAEGRNLLKRKMRLGRNQFLYDASPEAESCLADDEAAVNMTGRTRQQHTAHNYQTNYPHSLHSPLRRQLPDEMRTNATSPPPPLIPPLPIFDDFDFEEFLSSFQNDDEQFPLFKDCREFLLNRTSNKHRSTLATNSNSNNNNNNNNTNTNNSNNNHIGENIKSPLYDHQQQQQQRTTTSNYFQFPTNNLTSKITPQSPTLGNPCAASLLNQLPTKCFSSSSSFRTNNENAKSDHAGDSVAGKCCPAATEMPQSDHSDHDDPQKREIFISIETTEQQNELVGHSPISPNSLRRHIMAGASGDTNAQAMLNNVEVELDADVNDENKFTKFTDDEPLAPPTPAPQFHFKCPMHQHEQHTPFAHHQHLHGHQHQHLPNVQLNNAKNLIQKMQDDFRQRSHELVSRNTTMKPGVASMLYCDDEVDVDDDDDVRVGRGDGGDTNSPSSLHSDNGGGAMHHGTDTMADADSDEMSSLDGYPIGSQSSHRRHGVASKLSADSAYGSLSRQRSSELVTTPQTRNNSSRSTARPLTSSTGSNTPAATTPRSIPVTPISTADAKMQHRQQQQQQDQPHQYSNTTANRTRQYSGSGGGGGGGSSAASSSSENSELPTIATYSKKKFADNNHHQHQHQHQYEMSQLLYSNNTNNNNNNDNNTDSHNEHYNQNYSNNNNIYNSNNDDECNNNFESSFNSPSPPSSAVAAAAAAASVTLNAAARTGNLIGSAITAPTTPTISSAAAAAAVAANQLNANTYSNSNPAMSTSMKMSKFCHECGSKFIVEQAKFCMDCGIRRIVL